MPRMNRSLVLTLSHLACAGIGFAVGIYLLPILVAPDRPNAAMLRDVAADATFHGEFRRDHPGSDPLHWGEGRLSVGPKAIALEGRIAPGPDYKLYLLDEYVGTEADFKRVKSRAVRVGSIRTFENFIVPVPEGIDVSRHTTVVIWCETFSQFITSTRYR